VLNDPLTDVRLAASYRWLNARWRVLNDPLTDVRLAAY